MEADPDPDEDVTEGATVPALVPPPPPPLPSEVGIWLALTNRPDPTRRSSPQQPFEQAQGEAFLPRP
jgi:hypothetical protein